MTPPMIRPPRAPTTSTGAYALVMIALGRLSSRPKVRPVAQPGHGSWTQPMTTPMAKRSTNAALGATDLSGNDIGNIIATDATPKTRPAAIPSRTLDIVWAVLLGFSPWPAIARERPLLLRVVRYLPVARNRRGIPYRPEGRCWTSLNSSASSMPRTADIQSFSEPAGCEDPVHLR